MKFNRTRRLGYEKQPRKALIVRQADLNAVMPQDEVRTLSSRSSKLKPASATGDLRDGLAACLGRGGATKIACPKRRLRKRGVDGIGYAGGSLCKAKMFEHHCRRPDLTDRIGDALSGNVRRRAMNRF